MEDPLSNLFLKMGESEDPAEEERRAYRRRSEGCSIETLYRHGFELVQKLGKGAFGSVIEVQHREFDTALAFKIVLEKYVSRNELKYWSALKHENVVELISVFRVPAAKTFAFLMAKHQFSLVNLVQDSSFRLKSNCVDSVLLHLKGVFKGLSYLHENKYCHMDLKLNNVLVSDLGIAKITDFGSLTKTEMYTDSYTSPFIYRAPEAQCTDLGPRMVNGFSYDVYTVGMLILELFTGQRVWRKTVVGNQRCWPCVMYPSIFQILEVNEFRRLVKETFPNARLHNILLRKIRNLVITCLNLNPEARPKTDALENALFLRRYAVPVSKKDAWSKRVTSRDVASLIIEHRNNAEVEINRISCKINDKKEDGEESDNMKETEEKSCCTLNDHTTISYKAEAEIQSNYSMTMNLSTEDTAKIINGDTKLIDEITESKLLNTCRKKAFSDNVRRLIGVDQDQQFKTDNIQRCFSADHIKDEKVAEELNARRESFVLSKARNMCSQKAFSKNSSPVISEQQNQEFKNSNRSGSSSKDLIKYSTVDEEFIDREIFDILKNEWSRKEVICDHENVSTVKLTLCQRVRKWFKKKKAGVRKLFCCCCPVLQ